MKINLRAGLLVILLAVPAFLFLFLFFFGENRFDLPYLLPIGTIEKGEIVLSENLNTFSNSDLVQNYAEKSALMSDSLYLTFAGLNTSGEKSIKIIYDCPEKSEPSEIHLSELERIEEKIQNKPNIQLLLRQDAGTNQSYFENLYALLKRGFNHYYFPDGMLMLIDSNNYFRGFYNPSVKSDVDRLITEYQILLDDKNEYKRDK